MAVKREGGYYRKLGTAQARLMQERQAQAIIRKLDRRIRQALEGYNNGEREGWFAFMHGCIADIGRGSSEGRAA